MKSISQQIKQMRRASGLSLQCAARRMDTSAATLSRYENGWKRFEIYTLNKIAMALGYYLQISFRAIPRAGRHSGHRQGRPPSQTATICQLKRLFWDIPLNVAHLEKYPAWVVKRVLEYGTLRDIQSLIQLLGRERFLDIVSKIRLESARTKIFWQQILKKENRSCMPKSFHREAAKSWPS